MFAVCDKQRKLFSNLVILAAVFCQLQIRVQIKVFLLYSVSLLLFGRIIEQLISRVRFHGLFLNVATVLPSRLGR